MKRISVRFTEDELEGLRLTARNRGLSVAALAREAVLGATHINAAGESRSSVRIHQVADGRTTIEVRAYVGDDLETVCSARDNALEVYNSTRSRLLRNGS